MLVLLLLLYCGMALFAGESASGEAVPAELLRKLEVEFSRIGQIEASFHQVKHLRLLSRKLELRGRLLLRSPDYFLWEIHEPIRTRVTADGENLTVWDEFSGTQQTNFGENPVLARIWEQMDAWFRGRYSRLEQDYDMELLSREPLCLKFTPKSEMLRKTIAGVITEFNHDLRYLRRVEIREASGDYTEILFENIKLGAVDENDKESSP